MESLVRQLASLSRLARILPSFLLALTLSVHAEPEAITIEDGKVTLLQSILVNTTWPEEEEIDRFILGLYGKDRELLRVLIREMTKFKVREKSVVVTVYESLLAARAAHILVLAPSVNSNLAEIDRELHQSQTLIVTDGASDKRNIMVNFTHPSETRLSFEINRSNIVYAGLNLSKDMLLFGGSKLDLAAIYEETEAELVRAKATATEQKRRLEEQQKMLADQGSTIERQRSEVAANQRELATLEQQLAGIQKVLEESETPHHQMEQEYASLVHL